VILLQVSSEEFILKKITLVYSFLLKHFRSNIHWLFHSVKKAETLNSCYSTAVPSAQALSFKEKNLKDGIKG